MLPSRLRALIVDDSAIYRRIVEECLQDIPDVECVGVAGDGREAIEQARRLSVDLILLDVEMPQMDGLQAIPGLLANAPRAAIIMVSSLTTRGADVTMEALQAGAFAYVTKPRARSGEDGFATLRQSLQQAVDAYRERLVQLARPVPMPRLAQRPKISGIDLVVIGVSTGGPSALAELIPALPRDLPAPVVIVQHMSARFTASLARFLAAKSSLPVAEAAAGQPLQGGCALIAPGGTRTTVVHGDAGPCIQLADGEPVSSFIPSVDVLFESAAEVFGSSVLGLVLTGMGCDGLAGATAIRRAGGYCIAQDRDSCAVFGMPRALIEAEQADEVLSLRAMAPRLEEILYRP
jgi:two-component system chemotaxis response regulator CheB